MAQIVILDDDYALEALVDELTSRGHHAERAELTGTAAELLAKLTEADFVVLDIILRRPVDIPETAARGGLRTGFVLAQRLHQAKPALPILALSATQDEEVQDWFRTTPNVSFMSKLALHSISDVAQHVEARLSSPRKRILPRPFIVHGQDEAMKLNLKNYLQNVLGFPEPIILHEQPSGGRLLLEKLEHYSAQTELVFVLLTPDDRVAGPEVGDAEKRRARQNVIFELGYFLGVLKRSTGRVLLLHRGPLELPSDISGLVYIDVSRGVDEAGEQIRKELRDVIGG